GRLYRVWTGSSSPRLRYRITHQKIRPHTKNPTTSAAITDPIHMSYIRCDWSVMPPCGHPNPPNASPTSRRQPLSSVTTAAPAATKPMVRVAIRPRALLAPTSSRLPSSDPVGSRLPDQDHRADVGRVMAYLRADGNGWVLRRGDRRTTASGGAAGVAGGARRRLGRPRQAVLVGPASPTVAGRRRPGRGGVPGGTPRRGDLHRQRYQRHPRGGTGEVGGRPRPHPGALGDRALGAAAGGGTPRRRRRRGGVRTGGPARPDRSGRVAGRGPPARGGARRLDQRQP